MKYLICALSFFAAASGFPRHNNAGYLSPLIIGGEDVEKNTIPYQLSLRYNGVHIYGATLLSERFAITAAHCLFQSPTRFTLVAGEHLTDSDDGTEQTRSVSQWIIHPDYDVATFANDIAILRLTTPFTLNDQVKAINLPLPGYKATGNGVVSGWGSTIKNGQSSDILRKKTVPIHSEAVCQAYFDKYQAASMFCAGNLNGGGDFCQGDDGGPFTVILDNQPLLAGIASALSGCGQTLSPGLYTEVAYFSNWIRAIIN
jgi:secreted trypsin-like serine protease